MADSVVHSIFVVITAVLAISLVASVFKNRRLEKLYKTARQNSITDELTGLFNRRYLDQRLVEEISRANRHKYNLYLLVIDLDNFKAVNDTLGHQAGDQVLTGAAKIFKNITRPHDVVARSGGDEFTIIVAELSLEQANLIAQRIVRAIEKIPINQSLEISASVGLHAIDTSRAPEDAIKEADRAMYEAKTAGKDRVAISPLVGEKIVR